MKKILILLGVLIFIISCAGNKPKPNWTAAQYYEYAKKIYENEDYYEAANQFTVVVLRYPGSTIADSAQFFLAESQFYMKEFLVAASEYEKLISNYNRSPLVALGQYKLAECYYNMSPRAALDQEYSEKSIRAYQNYIDDFPTDKNRPEAEKRMITLRDRLSKKKYLTAEIYRKMRKYRAALIYYDEVLGSYYDSDWADDAMLGKIKTYIEQEDYINAKNEFEKFKQQFQMSELQKEAAEAAAEIPVGNEIIP